MSVSPEEKLLQAIVQRAKEDIDKARKQRKYKEINTIKKDILHNPLLLCYYDKDTLEYITERM